MPRFAAAAACALLCSASAWAQSDSIYPSKDQLKMRRLLDEAHVPNKSRTYLRAKMKKHSQEMRDLVMKVVLLDYEAAKRDAQAIANEPRLDRSASEASELPESFFQLQDTLKKRAEELAGVADKKDPQALAGSLTTLVQTCVGCHAVFRTPPPADAGTGR